MRRAGSVFLPSRSGRPRRLHGGRGGANGAAPGPEPGYWAARGVLGALLPPLQSPTCRPRWVARSGANSTSWPLLMVAPRKESTPPSAPSSRPRRSTLERSAFSMRRTCPGSGGAGTCHSARRRGAHCGRSSSGRRPEAAHPQADPAAPGPGSSACSRPWWARRRAAPEGLRPPIRTIRNGPWSLPACGGTHASWPPPPAPRGPGRWPGRGSTQRWASPPSAGIRH